ncbi:MAG: hypothetical protein DRR19_23495 [Candidatus Parabeggiatoa sp. nov. 1]|nr:MAG: hypothetical protein DRR19_23495 [Gammaproteobacteria bacterium]
MIVFYESQEPVWFKQHCYAELTTDKTFFSNYDEWVEDFNNKDIEELKSLVKSWLPPIGNISGNEDNTILYIPFEMKDKLIKVLKYLGFNTKNGDIASVPTSKKLGLGPGETRTVFYDNMEIKEVSQLVQGCVNKKLEKVLDDVVADPINPIGGIFLFDLRNGFLICESTNNELSGNINLVAPSLCSLINFDEMLSKFGTTIERGKLNSVVIQLTNGMIRLYFVNLELPILLGFVSTKNKGIGQLIAFSDREYPKIIEELKLAM